MTHGSTTRSAGRRVLARARRGVERALDRAPAPSPGAAAADEVLGRLLAHHGEHPRVVALSPPPGPPAGVPPYAEWRDITASPERLHRELAALGTLDLIVVHAAPRRWPRLLRQLVFHTRAGGSIVFRGGQDGASRPLRRSLRELDRVRAGEHAPATTEREQRHESALASAVGAWRVEGADVVVTSNARAFAKLHHHEVDEMLEQPGLPQGRILAQVPAATFTARCSVVQNDSPVRRTEVRQIAAPALSLRAYDDVVCLPRQVVVQDSVVLPDSYRHWHRRRLGSLIIDDLAPRFAGLPQSPDDATPMRGTYVYLDSEFPGHYGHLLTEQLARLWAWPAIREAAPDAKVLISTRTPRARPRAHERELLAAFDIFEEDLHLFHAPVRVERLLSAVPAYSHPSVVHPVIEEAWRRAGDALAARAPQRSRPPRIFCGRRTDKRRCRNGSEVEALFTRRGFEVVYPEDHPVPEQAAMFRDAEVIAGYAGAAMFNLCYTATPKDVVMLVPESYTAQNEYLMAAVQGHRLTLVWCPSDLPQPATGFSPQAYQSAWVFDRERDGGWLKERLDELVGND